MATVELTLEQILDAARQLTHQDRVQLIAELAGRPKGEDARRALEQLRDQFSMDAKRQRRMSLLLAKGNNGELNPKERAELDALVDEFQQRALELAQAVARAGSSPPPGSSGSRQR